MTKLSVDQGPERTARPTLTTCCRRKRSGTVFDVYAPVHQIHYRHQGERCVPPRGPY